MYKLDYYVCSKPHQASKKLLIQVIALFHQSGGDKYLIRATTESNLASSPETNTAYISTCKLPTTLVYSLNDRTFHERKGVIKIEKKRKF